jgi:hypothetical protein
VRRVEIGQVIDAGEHVGQAAARVFYRPAVPGDDTGGVRTGGLHRDLLTEHHPDGQLRLVYRAGDALSRRLRHEGTEPLVGAQRIDHRFGIGIEVEQSTAAGDRRGQVAQVVEYELAPDVVGMRCERYDPAARRQPQGAAVGAVAHLLDPRDRARRQMPEQSLEGERGAHR